jgi:hypothetical protein
VKSFRVVLAVGVAISVGAGVVLALQSCALPDYEVGTVATDATVDGRVAHEAAADVSRPHPRHDTGVDAHAHDSGKKPDAAPDAPPGCVVAQPPGPPMNADMPSSQVFTLAVRSIDFGESDTTAPGYDLDYDCTCIDDGPPSCVSLVQHCDFPGGVDNAALTLIQQVEFVDPLFGSTGFSSEANGGGWSLLIQLSGYATGADGGVANDPNVTVNLFASPHSITPSPGWDGLDQWAVSPSSVGDGGLLAPRYTTSGAYVANHVLVAAIPEVTLVFSGSTTETIAVRLTGGSLTGTLEWVDGQPRIIDGIIAARWAEPDIFASLASYRANSGPALCMDNAYYGITHSAVCASQDILAGVGSAAEACNAISMGIGFTAYSILPLTEADIAPPTVPSPGCPDATSPMHDTCDSGVDAGSVTGDDAGDAAKDAASDAARDAKKG